MPGASSASELCSTGKPRKVHEHRAPRPFRSKDFVMAYLRQLAVGGYAEWHVLENGDIRLRLLTGETYLLAETAVIRIA